MLPLAHKANRAPFEQRAPNSGTEELIYQEAAMTTVYSYACKDYPGMEACPGRFSAQTEDEVWKHMELHASIAHQEDPTAWTVEDKAQLKTLIKTEAAKVAS